MVIRVTSWILRISFLAAIILGIIFWTGNANNLKPVHIVIGFILVISLFVLGIAQGMQGGSFGLALATFVVGIALAFVGLFQERWLRDPDPKHWIIQVIHLLLALTAIGLGEMITARASRRAKRAAAA